MWILQLVSPSDTEVLKCNEGKCTWDNSNEAIHENNGNLNISNYKTKSRKHITARLGKPYWQ